MKGVGYLSAITGLVAVAASMIKEVQEPIYKFLALTASKAMDNYFFYGGIVLVVLGVLILSKFSRPHIAHNKDVPIYKGQRIVGYRRG